MKNFLNNDFYCLIMAGGKGTRFWPESTEKKPKQYLNLIGKNTLLEETLFRFDDLISAKNRYIVTVENQLELCKKSSHQKISENGIFIEPSGRNTAPCILMALAHFANLNISEDSVIAIVPSDHVILNANGFKNTLKKAYEFSNKFNQIVTIGITPTFPHTGFGYIEKGELIESEAFKVKKFKEKPHFELAKEYVRSGLFLWNAGMFVAPLKVLLNEFKIHAPQIFQYYLKLKEVIANGGNLSEVYEQIPNDSIDYAIIEKSNNISTIPANFDWNDLGSWDALSAVIDESNGNTIVKSNGNVFLNSFNNIIFTPDKLVALINMQNHIVVSNEKVVLVAPIADSQEIKKIVEQLKQTRPDLI